MAEPNRFVVMLESEYDGVAVKEVRPIETVLSHEDLMEEFRCFADSIVELRSSEGYHFYEKRHVLDLGGTGLMVCWSQVLQGNLGLRPAFLPPKILTVDQWFVSFAHGG